MGDDFQESDDYQRRHGVSAAGGYQPPQVGGGAAAAEAVPTHAVPSQVRRRPWAAAQLWRQGV